MTIETYWSELRRGWKLIFAFVSGFLLLGLLYCMFLFQPSYVSKAKILIEEAAPTTFITDLGKEHKLETNSNEKNPILTQMEVLSSYDIADRVYQDLLHQRMFQVPHANADQGIASIQKSIKLKNPTATDIIEVSVAWNDPAKAHQVAQAVLDEYYRYNIGLNNQSVSQAKHYIQEQLDQSRKELENTRDQIRTYRKNNASLDLTTEVGSIVKQVSDTENEIADLQSRIDYHKGKVSELSSKLNIAPGNVQKALNSVALGQNDNLLTLNKNLNDAQQQYAALKVRYPTTTKRMTALRENIDEIRNQIQQQVTGTIGKSLTSAEHPVIKDSVRTKVVGDLIDNQAESLSLQAEKQSLENTLQQLKAHQERIPDQQRTLIDLMEKEANLSSIVSTLSTKLVEANVRESEITSNLNIVQAPTFPTNPSFPTRAHVVFLMMVAGFLTGCCTVLGRYLLQDQAADAQEIEALLNAPVLGTVSKPHHTLSSESMEEPLDYERTVTALKIKMEDELLRAFGFTGLLAAETSSHTIANIARILSNCNYSVLLIDANFRNTTLAQEFGIQSSRLPDLKELLLHAPAGRQQATLQPAGNTAGLDFQTSPAHRLPTQDYVTRIPDEKNLYLMSGNQASGNPYEVVTSKYFPQVIAQVKAQFDFVLVNLPPVLDIPDGIITARLLDGLTVICHQQTARTDLKALRKLCTDHAVNLMGAITRQQAE